MQKFNRDGEVEFWYVVNVENGVVLNFPRDEFKAEIGKASGEYEIVFKKYKKKRSKGHNSLMWFYFSVLGKEAGYSKENIRGLVERDPEFKDLFVSKVWDDRIEREVEIPRGTSDFSPQEMNEFLRRFRVWSMDFFGINLPEPREQTE